MQKHRPEFLDAEMNSSMPLDMDFSLPLGEGGVPIYVELATLFRRFIESGAWPVGDKIPTAEQLSDHFKINPATIRKATSILQREGLVRPFRRRGTFVIRKPEIAGQVEIGGTWETATRAFDNLVLEHVDGPTGQLLETSFHGLPISNPMFKRLRRRYRVGGQVAVFEDVLLEDQLLSVIGPRKAARSAVLPLLDRLDDRLIGGAWQTLRFGRADLEISRRLEAQLNAALVIIHQSVADAQGKLIFEARSYVRGELARMTEQIIFEDVP